MTVQSETSYSQYTLTSVLTPLPVTFRFLEDTDLKVLFTPISTGVPVELLLNSQYTVFGARTQGGGTVTLLIPTVAGDKVYIDRGNMNRTQLIDYRANDPFPEEDAEDGLDRLTMLVQQQVSVTDRAIVLPIGVGGVSNELPGPEALKLLRWKPDLSGLENATPPEIATVAPGAVVDATVSPIAGIQSNKLSFLQAGTGGIARTVQNRLRDTISAKDFGAIGDGTQHPLSERFASLAAAQVVYPHAVALTDQIDWAAIQGAINYLANLTGTGAKGGWLEIPPGRYVTNRELVVDVSKPVNIRGCGEGTQFRATSAINIFRLKTNMIIRDLMFVGAFSGTSTGIYMDAANVGRIEACIFQNQGSGVILNNTFAAEIISCVFDVCDNYGVFAGTSAHNTIIERCNFFSVGIAGNGQAIAFSVNSDNLVLNGNDFEFCNVNILLQDCRSVEITGNYLEYHKAACFLFGGTNTGIIIECNWIALGDSVGGGATLLVEKITGGRFSHNIVYNQTINFSTTTLVGFTVGLNNKQGTGTLAPQPWAAPTLVNSWTGQTNYSVPSYMKDEDGWVHLRGGLVGGTAPSTAFTLPAGYRPPTIMVFSTASANGAGRVSITPAGVVSIDVAASNNGSFDGIRFYSGN